MLQNVNKTPRVQLFLHLHAPTCMLMVSIHTLVQVDKYMHQVSQKMWQVLKHTFCFHHQLLCLANAFMFSAYLCYTYTYTLSQQTTCQARALSNLSHVLQQQTGACRAHHRQPTMQTRPGHPAPRMFQLFVVVPGRAAAAQSGFFPCEGSC